jgi:hypothetical protein
VCAKLDGLILVLVFRSVSIHGLDLSILSVDFANYNTFFFYEILQITIQSTKVQFIVSKAIKDKGNNVKN